MKSLETIQFHAESSQLTTFSCEIVSENMSNRGSPEPLEDYICREFVYGHPDPGDKTALIPAYCNMDF